MQTTAQEVGHTCREIQLCGVVVYHMFVSNTPTPSNHARISRRSLAKGVAWATPVAVVAGTLPAFAASPVACPVTLPPFSEPAWWLTLSGTPTSGTAYFSSGIFAIDANPSPSRSFSAEAIAVIELVAGYTYTFSVPWTAVTSSPLPMTMDLYINNVSQGTFIDTAQPIAGQPNPYVFSITPPATQTYLINFVAFISSPPGSTTTSGDDIFLFSIETTCETA